MGDDARHTTTAGDHQQPPMPMPVTIPIGGDHLFATESSPSSSGAYSSSPTMSTCSSTSTNSVNSTSSQEQQIPLKPTPQQQTATTTMNKHSGVDEDAPTKLKFEHKGPRRGGGIPLLDMGTLTGANCTNFLSLPSSSALTSSAPSAFHSVSGIPSPGDDALGQQCDRHTLVGSEGIVNSISSSSSGHHHRHSSSGKSPREHSSLEGTRSPRGDRRSTTPAPLGLDSVKSPREHHSSLDSIRSPRGERRNDSAPTLENLPQSLTQSEGMLPLQLPSRLSHKHHANSNPHVVRKNHDSHHHSKHPHKLSRTPGLGDEELTAQHSASPPSTPDETDAQSKGRAASLECVPTIESRSPLLLPSIIPNLHKPKTSPPLEGGKVVASSPPLSTSPPPAPPPPLTLRPQPIAPSLSGSANQTAPQPIKNSTAMSVSSLYNFSTSPGPVPSLGINKLEKTEVRVALTGDMDITPRALLMHFATGLFIFEEENVQYNKVDVISKTIAVDGRRVTLDICLCQLDQPAPNSPQICIYVYSMLDRASFMHLNERLQRTQQLYGSKCCILLCVIDHDMVCEWCAGNKHPVHRRLQAMGFNSRTIETGAGPVYADELSRWLDGEAPPALPTYFGTGSGSGSGGVSGSGGSGGSGSGGGSSGKGTKGGKPTAGGSVNTSSVFTNPPPYSPPSNIEVACWAVRSVSIGDRAAVKNLFEDAVRTFTTKKKKGTTWKQTLPSLPEATISQLPQQFHASKIKRGYVDETYNYLDELIHAALKKGLTLSNLLLFLYDEDVLFEMRSFTVLMAHFQNNITDWFQHLSPTHRLLNEKCIESIAAISFTEKLLPEPLPNGTTLCFTFMMLRQLPSYFEQGLASLTSVTQLNLSHNILAQVPSELFKIKTLQSLNLSWNALTSLPEIVSPPPRLQELNIEHNSLSEIPDSLGDCLYMHINCAYNQITSLPHTLAHHIRTGRLTYQPNPLPPALSTPDEVLKYLQQVSASSVVRWPKIKLALLGPEAVGKTTLIKRLQGKSNDGSSTDGILIQDIKLRDVSFNVWDFGGQAAFLPTHQFFLTGRAIYLVIFDLSNPNAQRTEYWLRQVARTVRTPPFPPVLLVGTRLDKLSSLEKAKEICSSVYSQFRHICLPIGCIPLDARDGDLEELESIICGTVIEKQALLREKVPGSWVSLDELLCDKKPVKRTLNWAEFSGFASAAGVDQHQVKKAAEFLHEVGSVVYYDSKDSKLGEYVVLDPKYLSDVMITMVTIKPTMASNGFLPREGLLQVWQAYDTKDHPLIIELLSLFLILYPVTLNGQEGYIVPCALSTKEPPEASEIWPETNITNYQSYERWYVFPIVPIGLFERVLLRVLHLHNITRHSFWHNNIRLEVTPQFDARNQFGSICFDATSSYSPFLVVTVRTPSDAKQHLLTKLLECVETTIECFYKNLQLDTKQLVTCPHCPDPASNPKAPTPHQFPLEEIVAAIASRSSVMCKVENIEVRPHTLVPDLLLETQFHIAPADLINMVPIGSGGFGKIYRATLDGRDVAVKELIVRTEDEEVLEKLLEFKKEVLLMSMLDNPFIVKLYGICVSPPMMIMEFVTMGDLFKILHKQVETAAVLPSADGLDSIPDMDALYAHPMSWRLRLQLALDVAQGLHYLQSLHPPIVHRDLRSPNIFVLTLDPSAPVRAKVADFGLSVTAAGKVSGNLTTWQWLAPEVIDSSSQYYDEQSDIFSFGVVCYEIITRQFPYDEYAENELYANKKGNQWEWRAQSMKTAISNGLRPTLPDSFPITSVRELIKQCWLKNPSERPKAGSIVESLLTILGKEVHMPQKKKKMIPLAEQPKQLWEVTSDVKIWSSASDPRSGTLWVGCADGTIRKPDAVHGGFVGTSLCLSQKCRIYCLLFIPPPPPPAVGCGSGRTSGEVWAGTEYGKIIVFDSSTGRAKSPINAHGDQHIIASMVAVYSNHTETGDVKSVWSVSSTEATVVMIHPQTKSILNKVSFNPSEVRINSMCQCMGYMWIGCYKKIVVLDCATMATNQILTRNILPSKYICPVSVDSNVWFGASKKICVFNSTEMSCVAQLAGHSCEVTTLCVSLGYVWSADIEGSIYAWHPETFVVVKKFGQTGVYYSTLFSASNHLVYATVHPVVVIGAYRCYSPDAKLDKPIKERAASPGAPAHRPAAAQDRGGSGGRAAGHAPAADEPPAGVAVASGDGAGAWAGSGVRGAPGQPAAAAAAAPAVVPGARAAGCAPGAAEAAFCRSQGAREGAVVLLWGDWHVGHVGDNIRHRYNHNDGQTTATAQNQQQMITTPSHLTEEASEPRAPADSYMKTCCLGGFR
ncbi:leucinerich repeat kinase [Pelomyxa schiedti]|nr:leucinerich repeat kinase [Pelomyxa schiedti]